VLYQYHHAHVTQPLLHEQLGEWGIEISAGQLSRLITEPCEVFHAEKEALLRAGDAGYVINEAACAYMRTQGLAHKPLAQLEALAPRTLDSQAAWQAMLTELGISRERHVRIATEGALLGAVSASAINPKLVIISDDAGQFDVLTHALCWIHAERNIREYVKKRKISGSTRNAASHRHNEYIERYHYLAYQPLPGAQQRYFVFANATIVALLGFGAAAWKCQPRDIFIGWSAAHRERQLHRVVSNARFLILPWVHCPNLASTIVARSARRLGDDWQARYGYRPVLLETFVEQPRFRGTANRAANWHCLGQT